MKLRQNGPSVCENGSSSCGSSFSVCSSQNVWFSMCLVVFSMIITVFVGYLVPFGTPAMQQRWIICWGMFSALNSVMDLILGIMYLVRYLFGMPAHPLSYFASTRMGGMQDEKWRNRKLSPLEEYLNKIVLASVFIGIVLPFVEIIIAWVCYQLFQERPQKLLHAADQGGGHGGLYGSAGYCEEGGADA